MVKPLLKKYPSFKADLKQLEDDLRNNPLMGTEIHPNIFKIRIAITGKGQGKRGGARVISYHTFDAVVMKATTWNTI
jgi:hypothetical protein